MLRKVNIMKTTLYIGQSKFPGTRTAKNITLTAIRNIKEASSNASKELMNKVLDWLCWLGEGGLWARGSELALKRVEKVRVG